MKAYGGVEVLCRSFLTLALGGHALPLSRFCWLPRNPLDNRLARLQSRFEEKNLYPYHFRTSNSAASSYHYTF